MCSVSIELFPNSPFLEVQIALFVHHPIKVEPNIHFINNLKDKEKVTFFVYQKEAKEVATLEMNIVISHITRMGVPRVLTKIATLPMKLIMMMCPVQHESLYKITLHINETTLPLSTIFEGK